MDEEMHAIEKNDTWKLTYPPESKKAIGVKWVYKTKKNAKEEVQNTKPSKRETFIRMKFMLGMTSLD
jgi:hypothetical protein